MIANAEEYEEDNPTFEYVAKEYLSWYEKRRKKSSYTRIKSIVEIYLIPYFGKRKINKIKSRDVTKFQDSIIDKNSLATNKTIHVVLSAIFNFSIRNEYATKNPARMAGNFEGAPKKRVDYWTLDEFKAFLNAIDDFMYYVLFMVLYYSGIRRGEALALTWGDIDFENNKISISKTHGKQGLSTTKTGITRTLKCQNL